MTEKRLLEYASKGYNDLVNQIKASRIILKELDERSIDKAKNKLMQEIRKEKRMEGARERLFLLNSLILSMIKTEKKLVEGQRNIARYESFTLPSMIRKDDATKIIEGLIDILPSGWSQVEVRDAMRKGSEGLKQIEQGLKSMPKSKRHALFLAAQFSSSLTEVYKIVKEQNAVFDRLRSLQALGNDAEIDSCLKQIDRLFAEEKRACRPVLKHFCQKVTMKGVYRDYEIVWFSPS
ncbi:TPA: hypothetical protein HA296_03845 [Candidatus Woesearchaeota archaeon]|nr:hypothetical protein [Candidatus Woesearchaeota archaeon]